MTLYKKELIDKIAEDTGLYKKDINRILDSFRDVIYRELQEDNTIIMKNLFKIQPVTMKPRELFVPLTQERKFIEERKTVKMMPSETLKQAVRGENSDSDDELLAIEKEIAKLKALQEKIKSGK